MTDTSDHDELVRLAGEQALLSRDLRNLNADQQRDLLALRNLPTDMVLSADWHAKGTALLDRLRDRQQQRPWANNDWPGDGDHLNCRQCPKHTSRSMTQITPHPLK